MPDRNLKALLSKIILFYSIFYVVMKLTAILFEPIWPLPNLIMALPFLLFSILGGLMLKHKKFYWAYVVAGIIIISLIRYYESRWVLSLHEYFG